LPETPPAIVNHTSGCLLGRFLENIRNHDCVGIDSVNDAPRLVLIQNAKFMTPGANTWHPPRVW
jgi:hypothetical protein